MKKLALAVLALAMLACSLFAALGADGREGERGRNTLGNNTGGGMMARGGEQGTMMRENNSIEEGRGRMMGENFSGGEGRGMMGKWEDANLSCLNGGDAKARAKCRMEFVRNASEKKTPLGFMPEECRNSTGANKSECLARKERLQECHARANDNDKVNCAKEKLNASRSARQLVEECKSELRAKLNTTENTSEMQMGIGKCVSEVRSNRLEAVKFRFDLLVDKAARLGKYGVSNDTIAAFSVKIEELKAKFDAAQGADAKKAVVREIEQAWKDFVSNARSEARAQRRGNETNSSEAG